MTQKGNHTWDLILHYHCCPQCGRILESRSDYKSLPGASIKQLSCPYCHHSFSAIKPRRDGLKPLFGNSGPVEVDWS